MAQLLRRCKVHGYCTKWLSSRYSLYLDTGGPNILNKRPTILNLMEELYCLQMQTRMLIGEDTGEPQH